MAAGARRGIHVAWCLWFGALLCGAKALPTKEDEPFIGWQGEMPDPYEYTEKAPGDLGRKWVEMISWKPRAFVFHKFMTEDEANHIKKLAAPTMRRSTVVGANGSSVLDDYRTSYGTFVKRKEDSIIEGIEERVANWVKVPPIYAEDMQVLRYGVGQQYKPHMDTLSDEVAGPRLATLLLYLNDVEEGGETAFPDSTNWINPATAQRAGPLSKCAAGTVAFKPKKGDALMFWSIKPNGRSEDHFSMHTGCPVVKGVKWTATKWVHSRPFRPNTYGKRDPPDLDPGLCKDAEDRCREWAKTGECKRNAGFMVGDVGAPGRCRNSCGSCIPCKDNDLACYQENRRRAGYLVYTEAELL